MNRSENTSSHKGLSRRSKLLWVAVTGTLVLGMLQLGCKGDSSKTESEPAAATPAAHTHPDGETCFICDPSKRDPGRLWCKEHSRYEDRCWECQPQLREADRPYCEEHSLYEDECFLCDPSRGTPSPASEPKMKEPEGKEQGALEQGANQAELFCNEHQVAEHDCGICQPQRAGELPVGDTLLVRLASERSADLAGLSIAQPVRADASTSISLLGEIRFNGNRLAEIGPLSSGVIAKIKVDLGQTVKKGEVLAVVNAPGVAEARAEYLSAQADLQMWEAAWERQKALVEDKVGSRSEMEKAEASYGRARAALKLARQRLQNLGVSGSQLATKDARSDLYLRAPFAGTVVKRAAVLGEAVESGVTMFEIADLGTMWVDISVPENDAPHIGVDTPIQVTVRGLEGEVVEGQITWLGPIVDPKTRMVRARGVVPNDAGALRDGMFADITAIVGEHPGALRLPASAIHRIDNLPFVFVRKEPDLFAAQRVRVGDRLPSDEIVVHEGIQADDAVVTTGGFSIKSALLASRLGAGCTDD